MTPIDIIESEEFEARANLASGWHLFREIIELSEAYKALTVEQARERLPRAIQTSKDVACCAYLFKGWRSFDREMLRPLLEVCEWKWSRQTAHGLLLHIYAREAAWWCEGERWLTSEGRRVIAFQHGFSLAIGGVEEKNEWFVFPQEDRSEGVLVSTDKSGKVLSMDWIERDAFAMIVPVSVWIRKKEIVRHERL